MKYTKEILQAAVDNSQSLSGVLRALGFASYSGSASNHIRDRLKRFSISTDHFTGLKSALGKPAGNRAKPERVFQQGCSGRTKASQLRRALLESGVAHACKLCGLGPDWNAQKLILVVDHCDGDWSNNMQDNLRFLCPNCHSQTPTYGARNRGKNRLLV